MSGRTKCRTAVAGLIVGAAGVVPLGLAASASADTPVTVAASAPCYTIYGKTRPPVTITASGFPADIPVTVDDDLGVDLNTMSNAAGQVSVTFPEPDPFLTAPGVKTDPVTVGGTDPSSFTTYSGTVVLNLTQFDFSESGTHRAPGLRAFTEKTTWKFSGFPEGRTIYGHYTYDNQPVAKQAFGKAQGPCGILTTRRRLYPATPRHKAYTIQVDSSSRYSRHSSPSGRLKLSLGFF